MAFGFLFTWRPLFDRLGSRGTTQFKDWYLKEEETTDPPTEHETKKIREHE